MLSTLYIKNYAIIEEVQLDFSKNLTVITGETGAGKSILLGALGLILGDRADTSVMYNKTDKCIIEAKFKLNDDRLKNYIESNDLDFDKEMIIRREIKSNGKSRAFINDTPTTLSVLKNIGSQLIDIHRQFDTRDINDVSFQLNTLDALAEQKELSLEYQSNYKELRNKQNKLKQLETEIQNQINEQEFIEFQLNELDEANLVPKEQDELEMEQDRLANAEQLQQAYSEALQIIEQNDYSILNQLQQIVKSFEDGGKTTATLAERLQASYIELEDISREINYTAEDIIHDPQRLQEVEERLQLLFKLQKKHQVESIDALLQVQADLQEKLDAFQGRDQELKQLQKEIESLYDSCKDKADLLSNGRTKVIPKLEKDVMEILHQLGMPNAVFKVKQQSLDELSNAGKDLIEFQFTANKGMELANIEKVASGGELSRLALAVKSIVASAIPLPAMIFDEIDAGVSGDIALKMGQILSRMSKGHQVICITHSAQIAAQGQTHYFIYKETDEIRTYTKVKALESNERIEALAVILSTNPPSNAAIENAKELLKTK